MKPLVALLLCTLQAAAQLGGSGLPNPTRLSDRKEFESEGVSLQPPEGCVCLSSRGPDGQSVITVSRVVRVEGRDEVFGFQVEVIADLEFGVYRRIVEGAQGAAGGTVATVDTAVRDGRASWRADLAIPGGSLTRLLALDAGDRIVAVSWTLAGPVDRECGAVLAEAVASLRVTPRERVAVPADPVVEWSELGASLKHPEGWGVTDKGAARVLRNPGDRFESLAFGVTDGSIEGTAREWEASKKRAGGPECIAGGEEVFAGKLSFVFRCGLQYQGIALINETRVVRHRGRLFFATFTARKEVWEERRAVYDAMLATLGLED